MEPTWTTYDGKKIPIRELTDEHLWNIIKYTFAMNTCPSTYVFHEAVLRGFLPCLSAFLPACVGYKSPSELKKQHTVEELQRMIK